MRISFKQTPGNQLFLIAIGGLISVVLYIWMGYFIAREETLPLMVGFFLLFSIYLWFTFSGISECWIQLLVLALIFRATLLLALPGLSDDYYRFIWDGKLLSQGYDPFEHPPSHYMNHPELNIEGINEALYEKLNSPEYYTIYPPISQFVFWTGAKFSGDSFQLNVLIMRIFTLLAETGNIILIFLILNHFQLPPKRVLFYALNPLVVLELTGNLHSEVFMIFFLLLCILLWVKRKWILSAVSIGFAVAAKLIPLIFMPLFLTRFRFKRVLVFYFFAGITIFALFYPIIGENLVRAMLSSASLYFQKFEFNASVYYLVREIGYWIKGYNIIETAGKYLALASFLCILIFVVLERNRMRLPTAFMFVLVIYFLFTSILHPWYITTLVPLALFSRFRFPILWTGLVFLTYSGYSEAGFRENLYLVALEHLFVIAFLIYEMSLYLKYDLPHRQNRERIFL